MSDWQVGDLAVCVDASPDFDGEPVPLEQGTAYRVSGVAFAPRPSRKWGARVGLNLLGVEPWPWGYASERFRKVVADEHEACETEFVTLLKRLKRKVSA